MEFSPKSSTCKRHLLGCSTAFSSYSLLQNFLVFAKSGCKKGWQVLWVTGDDAKQLCQKSKDEAMVWRCLCYSSLSLPGSVFALQPFPSPPSPLSYSPYLDTLYVAHTAYPPIPLKFAPHQAVELPHQAVDPCLTVQECVHYRGSVHEVICLHSPPVAGSVSVVTEDRQLELNPLERGTVLYTPKHQLNPLNASAAFPYVMLPSYTLLCKRFTVWKSLTSQPPPQLKSTKR